MLNRLDHRAYKAGLSVGDQKHRLGPVAYLEFEESMPKWEFAAGALFGVSDATSDVTFKFDAEVKF